MEERQWDIFPWESLRWAPGSNEPPRPRLPEWHSDRITQQLALAQQRLASLSVEYAYWILIPTDESARPRWISAIGRKGELSARIRLPTMAVYDPSAEEMKQLLRAMRECERVLHVHNHPLHPFPNRDGLPEPSKADKRFAASWRARVGNQLLFFIISGDVVVEYADIAAYREIAFSDPPKPLNEPAP